MKRRLVLAVTALALVAGGAGIASAATPNATPHDGPGIKLPDPGHQTCLVFYMADGSKKYLCLNY